MILRSLNKRLADIESKIGPAEPEDPGFAITKGRFLAALADDPFYQTVIAGEFHMAQLRLLEARGVSLRDVTVPPGVPTVPLRRGATTPVPEGDIWDSIWLALDPEAALIRDVLDQTASYLEDVWEGAKP